MSTVSAREAEARTFALLQEKFGSRIPLERDQQNHTDTTLVVPRENLLEVVTFLRDTPGIELNQLLDVLGIDYLGYPGHDGARFAVVYLFKSVTNVGHRFKLKVRLHEEDMHVPSLTSLFRIADWMERETFDQFGVIFEGHPNLKRLLNHHEFVGHPLRKDYPAQKRQWLSANDPMADQLEKRLVSVGFQLLEPIPTQSADVDSLLKGSIRGNQT